MFKDYPVSDWYQPNEEAVKVLQAKQFELIVVHAPWCGDCQYTLPLVKKLLEKLPNVKVVDCLVDRQKKDPAGIAEKYQAKRIPTLIALQNGQEVARITEFPEVTIEQDIAAKLK
ncbi:Thioredoxin_domain-containing protein [Hexamita inflata]|uniref:Thioredoxin domain-containing protein n=1 Tax=Hexamita inflata TaxID=28002 RepID=A0AA86TVA4_9EUKA|nr:Thioredoxin domain-containing protein [Hexamita inflata]CAI9930220.1 Thioredoxin domain-containing protein [Hexamita inflata]CAI9934714.1 Thioredoxin domain-containing protein [Hexamita inflata]